MKALDALGLLDPGALYFLAIVPALILAYLARERPRQVTVSSVLAFRALHVMRGQRFGGRPRLSWTFFLELLALCLAVLAMAGPYVLKQGSPIAVVIDNSAPMQAETPSGQTRFANAVAGIEHALDRASGVAQVSVYLTAPQPHPLGRIAGSAGEAKAMIARTRPVDAPDDPAALTTLLAQLSADRHLGQIIFASYRSIAAPAPARLVQIAAGEPIANYAIGSFVMRRESFGAAALHARISVANFSPSAQTLTVTIQGDGRAVASGHATVAPGAAQPIDFPNLAPANIYQARLEPADGFMLDNTAYATGSAVRSASVLFISPTPADGASLRSIPGISVTTRTPQAYTPADLEHSDLAIFEYTVPKTLPGLSSLLVMPPPGDPVFGFTAVAAAGVQVAGWPTTDALTDGVNFRLLNLRSGEYLGQHQWMQAVVTGDGGGLILSGQRQGHRYLAAGFNPFPYLGRENLPMSILTLNLLGYLAEFGAQTGGYRTGELWLVPAGIKEIVEPSGRAVAVQPGTIYGGVTEQGIYQLIGSAGEKTMRAVNLADLTTSDLENVPPITVVSAVTAGDTGKSVVRAPFAAWLLAAIIGLIVFESMLVYRRRPREAQP